MITSVSTLLGGFGAAPGNQRHAKSEDLKEVAAEFEALLINQMLKSARESSSGGWLGGTEGEAGSVMVEMAEQQLAKSIASQGGLGLADLVISGMESVDPSSLPPK